MSDFNGVVADKKLIKAFKIALAALKDYAEGKPSDEDNGKHLNRSVIKRRIENGKKAREALAKIKTLLEGVK